MKDLPVPFGGDLEIGCWMALGGGRVGGGGLGIARLGGPHAAGGPPGGGRGAEAIGLGPPFIM